MQEALATLVSGGTLDATRAEAVFESILTGEAEPAQVGALLALIQRRGAAVEEIVGGARVMRRHVERVPYEPTADIRLIDTCGTGGAPKTFNISTASAIVAAAAGFSRGVRVAKHGNRSRTGRGSAEVLQALGVKVDASPATQARCLEEAGVCFCFAIHHHPAMRHAAGPRKALAFPTIFNLLGPLTNPAGATRQLIGVYDASLVEPMAEALRIRGAEHAMVVHGLDGLDEITTTNRTRRAIVRDGAIDLGHIDPDTLGLARTALDDLRAVSLDDGARLVRDALAGEAGPVTDIVALNAAAALVVAGVAGVENDFPNALARAREAIASGAATRTLDRLIEVSNA
ncbi:MAG: anthranilate phosphoribosyltransferase [Phycisphaerales bacterium]